MAREEDERVAAVELAQPLEAGGVDVERVRARQPAPELVPARRSPAGSGWRPSRRARPRPAPPPLGRGRSSVRASRSTVERKRADWLMSSETSRGTL